MRITPPKLVIATMLTAIAGMTGLTCAGTASAATTQAQVSGFDCTDTISPSLQILNVAGDVYVSNGEPATTQYEAWGVAKGSMWFCPEDGTTNGGVTYYYYDDSYGSCMTANASNSEAYEAPCGEYPASQEWHYYKGADESGTLENYYTSECLWFTGQPPKSLDYINVGGCTRNQNNTIEEEGD
jgi:hypothetical protein